MSMQQETPNIVEIYYKKKKKTALNSANRTPKKTIKRTNRKIILGQDSILKGIRQNIISVNSE